MRVAALVSLAALLGAEGVNAHWGADFEQFMQKFGKRYSDAEKVTKFANFVDNMMAAKKLTEQAGGTATYGMTPLSDLSQAEFERLNALRVNNEDIDAHVARSAAQGHNVKTVNPVSLPTSFDWRPKGAVTEVKDQARCGSCWAFGTVASIEGNNFVKNDKLISLSEQELVSCDSNDMGCNGGLPSNAYQWMLSNNQGLETESDYSYTAGGGITGTCKVDQSKERIFLSNYQSISQDEDEIAAKLMEYGPLAVAINASGLVQSYTGGIIKGNCAGRINHAVTIVGFGEENGQKFWTIKNSWGKQYGEQGYFRMARGIGQCLVNTMVTAANVKSDAEAVFV